MSFTFVNFIPSQRPTVNSKFVTRSFDPTSSLRTGYSQASITFYNSGSAALRVTVKPSYLQGRRSNWLKFGLYLQDGVKYYCTLFEDNNNKLDGTISTGGGSGGYGATDTGAIVSKINSSNLKAFVTAELINNYTNINYTGAGGIAAGDAIPMTGGRG